MRTFCCITIRFACSAHFVLFCHLKESLFYEIFKGIACFFAMKNTDGKIRATRTLETGKEIVEATLPCLITVEKDNFFGRLPNLEAYLASKTAAITTYTENNIDGLDLQKIGVPGSGTIVPKIYPPELPKPGQIIRTGSPRTDVGRLLELLTEKGSL